MASLRRTSGGALVAVTMLINSAPAAADDYVEAVGVLFGFGVRGPLSMSGVEAGAHHGVITQKGAHVMRMAAIVWPRSDARCQLDVAASIHDDRASGSLSHSVVDLRKVREIEIGGSPAPAVILLKGADLVCEREISLPNEKDAMKAAAVCRDAHVLDVVNPSVRDQVMPALRLVAKACNLPLKER